METLRLKKGEQRQINWDNLVTDLVDNCGQYHENFYSNNNFTGPSLHFHHRALNSTDDEKTEMTYAVLVSWGMHRMGGGAQMKKYADFRKSVSGILDNILALKTKRLENITENEMKQLETIFEKLDPMESKKKIVAISKVLAHYLPNIVAPIDNEYTFQFICQNPKKTAPPRNWKEFELFQEIHLKLFKKVIENEKFKLLAKQWLNQPDFIWDTSLPKIVDNLIIGKIKHLKLTDKNYKKTKIKSPPTLNNPN